MRIIAILLLILCTSPLFSQSSPKPENAYTHCFTNDEWAAFEEEVWAEEQATVKEAVTAAVEPYVFKLEEKDKQITRLTRWNTTLGIGLLVVTGVAITGYVCWALDLGGIIGP